jgi:hypothetical protein
VETIMVEATGGAGFMRLLEAGTVPGKVVLPP